MSWDPPAIPFSVPPVQMDAENQPHRYVGPDDPSSHPPLQTWTDDSNNIYDHAHCTNNHSFLGLLPPSCSQAVHDFNEWNCSTQGCFPLQSLQAPAQAGPSSLPDPGPPLLSIPQKRKRTTSVDSATAGGCGQVPGGLDVRTEPSTPEPSPEIKFNERKNSAYEIWAFTRPVNTDEVVPTQQWPDDYNDHLTKRPDATFVGCKLCTQFG